MMRLKSSFTSDMIQRENNIRHWSIPYHVSATLYLGDSYAYDFIGCAWSR
jgi:hypothetical protein